MVKDLVLGVYNIQLETNETVLIENDDKSVPFEVRKGDVVLLMGQNGSGKTALLEALTGQSYRGCGLNDLSLKCDKYFCGEPYNVNYIKDKIGYSENEIDHSLYHVQFWSCLKELTKGYKPYGFDKEYLQKIYDDFCHADDEKKQRRDKKLFWKRKNSLKHMILGKCSSGQKKKFSILKALGRKNAPLYIFDEPVNCLDYKTMQTFRDFIEEHRGGESAFVIITHCKIFKNPTRVYKIIDKHLVDATGQYVSHDCIDE